MIPPQFAYFAPTTLHDALTLLRQYGSEAKLLSGGQSLIPLMKLRLATPAYRRGRNVAHRGFWPFYEACTVDPADFKTQN
jgi:hypothetical protein